MIAAQVKMAARLGDVSLPQSATVAARNASNSKTWSPEVTLQAQIVTSMDPATIGKYKATGADPDLLLSLGRYIQTNPDVDPQTAWTLVREANLNKPHRTPLTKADEASLVSALDTSNTNSFVGVHSKLFLGTKVQIGLDAVLPRYRKEWSEAPYTNDRASAAIAAAREAGVRAAGGVAFMKMDNSPGAREWDDPAYFPGISGGAQKDMLAVGFRKALEAETGRSKNFKPEGIVAIMQNPDLNGKLLMSVVYEYKNDAGTLTQSSFMISGDAIKGHAQKAQAQKDEDTIHLPARQETDDFRREYVKRIQGGGSSDPRTLGK
jgi:hypothetical protein